MAELRTDLRKVGRVVVAWHHDRWLGQARNPSGDVDAILGSAASEVAGEDEQIIVRGIESANVPFVPTPVEVADECDARNHSRA